MNLGRHPGCPSCRNVLAGVTHGCQNKAVISSTYRLSEFQQRIFTALRRVPAGRVTTYALLARAVGCRSARAVGQALRSNPFAPEVPCHRVIASDFTPGGYQGQRTGRLLNRKLRLLAQEGVHFVRGRLENPDRVVFRF